MVSVRDGQRCAGLFSHGTSARADPGSQAGRVYGNPTAAGTYDVTFTATNSAGQGQRTVRFHVDALAVPAVNIAPRTVPAGVAFTHSITPAGELPAYGYSATGLPVGLNLDTATGVISGTPLYEGTYTIRLSAVNETGTGTGDLVLTVERTVPVVTGGTSTLRPGSWFYHAIQATNPPHSSIAAAPLPPDITLANGVLSGRPVTPGEYDITLTATNAIGTGTANLHLSVVDSPVPQWTVTTAADELDTPAGSTISLREALRDAPHGATITFSPALSGQTIQLTQGQLNIPAKELLISGPAAGVTLTIPPAPAPAARHMDIGAAAWVTLQRIHFTSGRAPAGQHGGAIRCAGGLTLESCRFTGNKAGDGADAPGTGPLGQSGLNGQHGGSGGAIWSSGTVTVTRCVFDSNAAGRGGKGGGAGEPVAGSPTGPGAAGEGGNGGAISAATVYLFESTVSSNTAGRGGDGALPRMPADASGSGGNGGSGGGIFASALDASGCLFAANHTGAGGTNGGPTGHDGTAGSGGGISAVSARLINCTLTGNSTAGMGDFAVNLPAGGAVSAQSGQAVHCTVTGNSVLGGAWNGFSISQAGGGGISGTASFSVENCIIAGNLASDTSLADLTVGVALAGANLIGVFGETAGPLNGTASAPLNPALAASLAWNGGPTRTLLPQSGSPALNAAVTSASTPPADQRGAPRVTGSAADLGAVEITNQIPQELFAAGLTISATATGVQLKWGTISGSYTLQESTTLLPGSWTAVNCLTLTAGAPGSDSIADIAHIPDGTRRFFRLLWQP